MTLYAVLRRLQALLAQLIGTCPTCQTASATPTPRGTRTMTKPY